MLYSNNKLEKENLEVIPFLNVPLVRTNNKEKEKNTMENLCYNVKNMDIYKLVKSTNKCSYAFLNSFQNY